MVKCELCLFCLNHRFRLSSRTLILRLQKLLYTHYLLLAILPFGDLFFFSGSHPDRGVKNSTIVKNTPHIFISHSFSMAFRFRIHSCFFASFLFFFLLTFLVSFVYVTCTISIQVLRTPPTSGEKKDWLKTRQVLSWISQKFRNESFLILAFCVREELVSSERLSFCNTIVY